jgi:hypothetical protein
MQPAAGAGSRCCSWCCSRCPSSWQPGHQVSLRWWHLHTCGVYGVQLLELLLVTYVHVLLMKRCYDDECCSLLDTGWSVAAQVKEGVKGSMSTTLVVPCWHGLAQQADILRCLTIADGTSSRAAVQWRMNIWW